MQTALTNGAPRARALKMSSSLLKPPAKAMSGTRSPLAARLGRELGRGRMQVEAGHAPFLHHAPRAHAGAAGSAVDGQQVDLGLATPLDGHGQLAQAVRAGLQGDPLEAEVAQPLALGEEALFVDEAEPAVALEFLDRAVFEGGLSDGIGRIGRDDVAALLQFQRPFEASRP